MRVAVAHEWLTNWAGSERVARQMVEVTQCDELVSSIVDPAFAQRYFAGPTVHGLWPSRLPGATTNWSRYALAMMAAWASVKIRADMLLVSSHFAAHGATLRFDGPSLVYYHTPARMVWRPDIELARLPRACRSAIEHLVLPSLRVWDRFIGRQPTMMLANSSAVARRIQQAYGRSATVLHPPVDVDSWLTVERKEPLHLLYFGRLVAYKKPWIAIEAARRAGVPLVVIGDGPERSRLKRNAPEGVNFLGHASDVVIRDAMANASGLIFPGEEDFGIAPIEALAAGVPVLAYAAGGALDYIEHGDNGLLVTDQGVDGFVDAIRSLRSLGGGEACRRSARKFGIGEFHRGLQSAINEVTNSGAATGTRNGRAL